MELIKIVLRKMYKNKGFVLFLLLGLLTSSALMSSIPLYTQGVLQKVLVKDIEGFQASNKIYPGAFSVNIYGEDSEFNKKFKGVNANKQFLDDNVKKYYKELYDNALKIDDYMNDKYIKDMPLGTIEKVSVFSTEPKKIIHDNFKDGDFDEDAYCRIRTLKDYKDHVKLIDGKLPQKGKSADGTYEVLISSAAEHRLNLIVNKEYVMNDAKDKGFEPIKIKPVGVFEPKVNDEVYWSACSISMFDESVVMNEDDFFEGLVKPCPTQLDTAKWFFSVDYRKLTLDNINEVYSAYTKIVKDITNIREGAEVNFELKNIINYYVSKEGQLKTTMWSLNVPVIIMLSIYLFMVSNLIINKERNEIALLISRGASRLQVVFGYIIEGVILGLIAFLLGPVLGMFLTKILGASNGFLEFVDRKSLSVHLSAESFGYSLLANIIFLVTLLIPAYKASNTSIVDHKRKQSREKLTTLWQKMYLDVILLAVSAYGYFTFKQRKQTIMVTASAGSDLKVDPLLFFVPVLFILGVSLLCLRLYPLFLKLVYKLGRKVWPPTMYGTLIQVSRSSVSYHFLMVFIMLTLSIGTFSATAARTINKNGEERIEYRNGADIILTPFWDIAVERNTSSKAGGPPTGGSSESSGPPQYIEPPFNAYEKLPGIEHAAKVFRHDDAAVEARDKNFRGVSITAIDPYDFGNVTWYRNGLFTHHINEYLNLLSGESSACIISTEMSKASGLKVGDSFMLSWGINGAVVFNVYGIVDYWPTYVPSRTQDSATVEPMFVIANLSYVQDNFVKEPYNIWVKLKDGASRQELYNNLSTNKDVAVTQITDTKEELKNLKNDSSQLAINGSLTLGFIISGMICFLGFVLYWVLSLKERSLQFGILRAIGLSSAQLKLMMVWEQVLTSGVAMVIGTFVGLLCSRFYVEFFRLSESYSDQIPPFRVISEMGDRMKVYGFIGITMVLGLGILIYLLSRIKISNVIKLGED